MKAKLKSVLVSGDVILDHHIYAGERPKPDCINKTGSLEKKAHGGAKLLFNLLSQISHHKAKKEPDKFNVEFGLNSGIFRNLTPNLQSYAIWKPHLFEREELVWRMVAPMGYGNLPKAMFSYTKYFNEKVSSYQDILVIDDAGLGFRQNTEKEAWPKALWVKKEKKPEWIILKMSNPVAAGDLWRTLHQDFCSKLVVVVSIEDLRREEVRITKGISWERSTMNLVSELSFNPNIKKLLDCKYLIINFGSEGALFADNSGKTSKFRLIFDPAHMEGEWGKKNEGRGLGYMSCLTAGIVNQFASPGKQVDVESGIASGLSAMRTMHLNGHGPVGKTNPTFPLKEVTKDILDPKTPYSKVDIPVPEEGEKASESDWTILTSYLRDTKKHPIPLYGIGRRVALLGAKALTNIPYSKFGKLLTVDRNEIESLRNIRKLIHDYEVVPEREKPLSLAVFGPPGSGKSFGIKQIAKGVLGKDVPILEFNLSQFGKEELTGAFHQVRDKVLGGKTPVVFWDEFDSNNYEWLQFLLAPMQDGMFQEGQITHPIGKCIFIFAGGTSINFENFGPSKGEDDTDFKRKKGPDFKSRLDGYLNVLGPNQRQYYATTSGNKLVNDPKDICYPVRRGLLIRAMLGLKGERLKIDHGVLSALIEIDKYKHGARSLEKTLLLIKQPDESILRRSGLPHAESMSLHLNYEKFIKIVNRDLEFQTNAEILAPGVHGFYLDIAKRPKYKEEYEKLPPDKKEVNIAAAERIPKVLDMVGLYVVPENIPFTDSPKEIKEILERNIEMLAEAEHEGWMDHLLKNGWHYGFPRNDEKKIHNCLKPYQLLPEEDKEKDRNSVRKYPELLGIVEYKIISSLPKE